MTKSKTSKYLPSADLKDAPVEFCWATFCKAILERGTERTLYNVLSSMKADILVSGEPDSKDIQMPLQELALYSLFKRKAGFEGQIDYPVVLEIENLETDLKELTVSLPPDASHSQQTVNFQRASVGIPSSEGEHFVTFRAFFKSGNKILGSAEFLVKARVSYERVGS